jgi:hypothetical protein
MGLSLRARRKAGVAISYSKKGSISEANPFNKEIATPERLCVQARNDKKDEVASLLAMKKTAFLVMSIDHPSSQNPSFSLK